MFEVITDTSTVKPLIKKQIGLEAEDEYAILYDWLSELLFFHDSEYLVFSKFDVKINSTTKGILKDITWKVQPSAKNLIPQSTREDRK